MSHSKLEVINHLASLYAPFLVNVRCNQYLTESPSLPNRAANLGRQLATRPAMNVSSTTGSLGNPPLILPS